MFVFDFAKQYRLQCLTSAEYLQAEKIGSSEQKPLVIMDLKYSTFNRICLKLKIQSALGRDWKGLAGNCIIRRART